jgi:hypothetical protein
MPLSVILGISNRAFLSMCTSRFLHFSFSTQQLCRMVDHVYDWLQDKTLGWVKNIPQSKIDTHHHFVPDFYAKGMPAIS